MTAIDWAILIAVYAVVVGAVVFTQRYMRGVADFLAAGRTAGRYLVSVASGIAGLGAITIVANLQMNYQAGFAMSWWGMSMGLFIMVAAVTGWVNYRFRATRCLTLAEFFERRYSRPFRVYAGLVAFSAGLINFGIFPAVGARFFIYYLGIPERFSLGGLTLDTFPVMMLVLLATAVYSVLAGGQVSVIISDFLQGLFTNIVFVILLVFVVAHVGWDDITWTLLERSGPGTSLVNPFDTNYIGDFNFFYFLIGVMGLFYGAMSWQGTQAYNASAKSAHEAKMGIVLGTWRGIPQSIFTTLIPIVMMTLYFHPDWAALRESAAAVVNGIANPQVADQMRVPIMLSKLLPPGLLGAFAAVMLACFISTHNTYLHSWGSIFIQDVVLPFRRTRLTPVQHVNLLRWSITGVAAFIFLFSLFYKQTEAILLFFALTGAIFAGGSGAVIIGGLYTRWGNTAAAWTAMTLSVALAVSGMVMQLVQGGIDFTLFGRAFSLNGQEVWGLGMPLCTLAYVAVALVRRRPAFDLAGLLGRGRADLTTEEQARTAQPPLWQRVFAITGEFTRGDKFLYVISYIWTLGWIVVFIAVTAFMLSPLGGAWNNAQWVGFWQAYTWIYIVVSVFVLIWFGIGGTRDIIVMLRSLAVMQRDDRDSGVVGKEGNETD